MIFIPDPFVESAAKIAIVRGNLIALDPIHPNQYVPTR